MNLNTKLSLILNSIKKVLQGKILYFQIFFENSIFFLFLGFLCGNLFGSFLSISRELKIWDGFIILLIVLCIEIISYLIYRSTNRTSFFAFQFTILDSNIKKNCLKCQNFKFFKNYIFLYFKKITLFILSYKQPFFIKSLNLFKIGILFGFFIDAFKVGS